MTTDQSLTGNSGPGYAKYPDHSVTLEEFPGIVIVTLNDEVLARSKAAILLTETGYSPVYYLPRADVDFKALDEVDQSTYCPFKGTARYWQLAGGAEPVAWGYDAPYDEVQKLSKCIAFYSDRVSVSTNKDD